MEYAGKTEQGLRKNNEDAMLVPVSSGAAFPHLVAVSDGMGGQACGEVASQLTIETLKESLFPSDPAQARQALSKAVMDANVAVYRMGTSDPAREGMGATLIAALIYEDRFIAANVGDSRLYLLKDGKLSQVSKDQSYVQSLVDAGIITAEQAKVHPRRNLITQAIGVSITVHPDLYEGELKPGDILFLCSDGVCSCIRDDQMQAILNSTATLEEKTELLIKKAAGAGSSDNMTAVLAMR